MPLPNLTGPSSNDRADAFATNGSVQHATLAAVSEALSRLRYGAIHLTVHDGKVVQLDVTERQRFT
jgi:hypothetical protein